MELKIVNKARHLLIIPLNSGKTVHLAPGETSAVESHELNGNAKAMKLQKSNLIATVIQEKRTVKSGGVHKKSSKNPVTK